MKKLILALLAVGSFMTANAQKGTILVYGDANVSTDNSTYANSNTKGLNWGINPGVGYQFNNHMTVGIQGGFNQGRMQTSNTDPFGVTTTSDGFNNNYSAGAFFRYTKVMGDIFYMYTQLNLSYLGGNTNPDGNNNIGGTSGMTMLNTKYNGFGASIMPVIGIMVGHGMALNFGIGGIGYSAITTDVPAAVGIPGSDYSYNTSKFSFTWGQQLNIGVSKNIGCGRHHGNHEMGDDMRHIDTSNDADDDAPKAHKASKGKHHHHRKHGKIDNENNGENE